MEDFFRLVLFSRGTGEAVFFFLSFQSIATQVFARACYWQRASHHSNAKRSALQTSQFSFSTVALSCFLLYFGLQPLVDGRIQLTHHRQLLAAFLAVEMLSLQRCLGLMQGFVVEGLRRSALSRIGSNCLRKSF